MDPERPSETDHSHEGDNPEYLSPQEALRAFRESHTDYLLQEMRKLEWQNAGSFVDLIMGDAEHHLHGIHYGKRNAPNFGGWGTLGWVVPRSLSLIPGQAIEEKKIYPPEGESGFIIQHQVTREELEEKVEYQFGRDGITPLDSIRFIGENFEHKAESALNSELDVLNTGRIRKELVPGVTLNVNVVDQSHWSMGIPYYQDLMRGQEQYKYKAVGSYATVPVFGEYPVTAVGLIEESLHIYRQDFLRRYESIMNGKNPLKEQLKYVDTSDWKIDEAVASYLRRVGDDNPDVQKGLSALELLKHENNIPYEIKLYTLARLDFMLTNQGKEFTVSEDASLDERIAQLIPLYEQIDLERQEAARREERERLDMFRKAMNREVLPSMTEEEKNSIIDHNLELLEHSFVTETPYWELDDTINTELRAIRSGSRMVTPGRDEMIESIGIRYETASGKIGTGSELSETLPGDFSILPTFLKIKGRKREQVEGVYTIIDPGTQEIQLIQEGNGPTRSQLDRAVMGESAHAPDEEHRRILPERIIPGKEQYTQREPWGESEFTPNIEGDWVFLRTIQLFNQRHGKRG